MHCTLVVDTIYMNIYMILFSFDAIYMSICIKFLSACYNIT